MSSVLSARVDEATLRCLDDLARRSRTTKKALIERAIRELSERMDAEADEDVLDRTFGSWHRDGDPAETVRNARETFERSMRRRR